MTLNHKIKTYFSRFRWYLRAIKAAMRLSDEYKDYKVLFDLRSSVTTDYLKEQRTNPTSKKLPIFEAKIELLNQILNVRN